MVKAKTVELAGTSTEIDATSGTLVKLFVVTDVITLKPVCAATEYSIR